ncbi:MULTISPECIES: Ail/Lom family outer membrane beta-barrel protein [Pantoea]|uniref:Outer membrane beta-barrel protein n=1 Tax=Candidatus Pantoea multigeneris TaxID=2608357 RepID=A0ABX0RBS9_9GAMM|nr:MULTISPECIES: Ail/Lom family outer membrane beta-barrel protein [Pantoea]NIF21827.1 outer membrane beta-barrel protein [Pantoea multigeneris]
MKKIIISSALVLAGLTSVVGAANAAAGDVTTTIGYAQSHFNHTHGTDAKGVQLQGRYELTNDWGVMGGITYTGNNYSDSGDGSHHYFSLKAGPTYRINDWSSVYADVGYGYASSKFSRNAVTQNHDSSLLVYGAGVQFNPYQNIVLDAGYEYGTAGHTQVGTWNVGVGYKF